MQFLAEVFPGDRQCVEALQEWFGYLLTGDTSFQKFAMLIGRPRSGKGTILRVIERFIGKRNIASTSLQTLAGDFGLESIYGKSVAVLPDVRVSSKSDWSVALERVLSITGEDIVPVNRKNRAALSDRLPVRFVLAANEMPQLPDGSGAVAMRMLVIPFRESFAGREDIGLREKLDAELPGIVKWAAEGLRRLRARGKFIQPDAGKELIQEFLEIASPITCFVQERCQVGDGYEADTDEIYQAYSEWCKRNGQRPVASQQFGRDLQVAFPRVKKAKDWKRGGSRGRYYPGIRLATEDVDGHSDEDGDGHATVTRRWRPKRDQDTS